MSPLKDFKEDIRGFIEECGKMYQDLDKMIDRSQIRNQFQYINKAARSSWEYY